MLIRFFNYFYLSDRKGDGVIYFLKAKNHNRKLDTYQRSILIISDLMLSLVSILLA